MANEIRLIDANALKDALRTNDGAKALGHSIYKLIAVYEIIDKMTTVDAKPVVHGRWKYYHKQNIAVCTNCSFERNLDENFGKAVSCPNCGADMRER